MTVNINGGFTTVMQCSDSEASPTPTGEAEQGNLAKIQALEQLVEDLAARVEALEEFKVNAWK